MQENKINTALYQDQLIVRITRRTLAFAVTDKTADAQVAYEPYTVRSGISMAANLREAFKSTALLQRGYKRVNILVDVAVMLVPIEEFQEEDMQGLYRYTFGLDDGDTVVHQVLPDLNAVAVFPINKDIKLVVDDHFTDVRITPLIRSIWTYLHRKSFIGMSKKLYGYFHDKKLELFAFSKNRFKFYNSFELASSRDAVYFIMYVWEQLGMDKTSDELHLVGDIVDSDGLKISLSQFIRKVYINNLAADFSSAPITAISGLPYDLITLFAKGTKGTEC
ncbi:DUF3822 family protein [Hoylesella saccharolytica]|uniref:DUF3822 family protein n=1 Tax=Hoylesella saccharolytica TaxID=633701 RepID=UPI0028EEAB0F|nr:DUF3822 family protein [Hoylesella saccharolytica]